MDLIIKPTERCNFKCTFCSSTKIADKKSDELPLEKVYEFIEFYKDNLRTIIVNGGDPLMMSPRYYFNILEKIEEVATKNKYTPSTILAFTSNLWDFYKNPGKWVELFNHPLVSVTTSFQLDDTRRISDKQIYTKELFLEVYNLYKKLVPGKDLSFISVITYKNLHTCMDLVKLAKELGTTVKLNYVNSTGRSLNNYFLLGDMYQVYIDIKKAGLEDYEFNTKNQFRSLKEFRICPLSRNCDLGIRCLQPNGDLYSCGSFGDLRIHKLNNIKDTTRLLDKDPSLLMMHPKCATCKLFDFCNGCYHTIHNIKRLNLQDAHCESMKRVEHDIFNVLMEGSNGNKS